MASNLPFNLKRHTMFRDKPYSHKVNFPDGFEMPEIITAEVRRGSTIIGGVQPEIVKEGQSFTFTYSPESLKKIQGLYDHYFLFDGYQYLGGQIHTVIEYGASDAGETFITQTNQDVTIVQMDSFTLSRQQALLAIQAKNDILIALDEAHALVANLQSLSDKVASLSDTIDNQPNA